MSPWLSRLPPFGRTYCPACVREGMGRLHPYGRGIGSVIDSTMSSDPYDIGRIYEAGAHRIRETNVYQRGPRSWWKPWTWFRRWRRIR